MVGEPANGALETAREIVSRFAGYAPGDRWQPLVEDIWANLDAFAARRVAEAFKNDVLAQDIITAERAEAVAEERERCARFVETHYDATHSCIDSGYPIHNRHMAAAIRNPDMVR